MLLNVSIVHSFLLMSSFPLYGYTTICLFFPQFDEHLSCFYILALMNSCYKYFLQKPWLLFIMESQKIRAGQVLRDHQV